MLRCSNLVLAMTARAALARARPARRLVPLLAILSVLIPAGLAAQVPPTPAETQQYRGLFAAAHGGDLAEAKRLIDQGADLRAVDGHARTALHVAAHAGRHALAQLLLERGANPNALDRLRYDIVTIAAVRNDVEMVRIAITAGADPGAVTSPYDGTALIAAAHLGHWPVIAELIAAGAPLDHVNNLGWTALIESIVLGDGGTNHVESLRLLVAAGADVNLADRAGVTPLAMARARGFAAMVQILTAAGAR